MKKKRSKKEEQNKPKVHKDLEGFDLRLNPFGEVISNVPIEKLNRFLNKNVDDLKLRDNPVKDGDEEE